jgi:hypothetical protein
LVAAVLDEGAAVFDALDEGASVAGALAVGSALAGTSEGAAVKALKVGAVVLRTPVGLDLTRGAKVGDALEEFDGNVVVG